MVDTTENWLVLNDSSLMTDLKIITATIKGIGSNRVQISGTKKIFFHLKSDDVEFNTITHQDKVFAPSPPYNFIPPQIIIK